MKLSFWLQPHNLTISVLRSIINLIIVLFFTYWALINASWIFFIVVIVFILFFLKSIVKTFPKTIVFEDSTIRVYLLGIFEIYELEYFDEVQWNEVLTKENQHILIIHYRKERFSIENFNSNYQILKGFLEKNLERNERIVKVFDSRRIGNFFNFESKATWTLFSLFAILFFGFFYKILNTKLETKAIKKFEGRIVRTMFYGKKDKSVGIVMEEFPDYVFNTDSRSFGYDFNEKNWINHQKISIYNGKRAVIYISASEYDWKIQNKLIRSLHFDEDFNFSIEALKIEK